MPVRQDLGKYAYKRRGLRPVTGTTTTMTTVRAVLMGFAATLCVAPVAHAVDPVEIDVSGEVSAVAGISDSDLRGDVNAEITVTGSTLFDNGVEVGAVLEGRLDGDQPDQLFGAGRYSGLLNGGPRGVGPFGGDAYLQGAYGYAKGAFGHIIIGRDQGIARTLAVTSPTIFRAINVNDWRTDLSGLNDVHTVNDFTGYSTKLTYRAPANFLGGVFGGLQLGASYSPSLRTCGDRLCAPENGFVMAPDGTLLLETAEWEDAVEAALYYQTGFGSGRDRLLLGVGASYVTAQEDTLQTSAIYDDYEAYSVGLNLAYRGITLGGSVKTTNAGLASLDDDGYLAFDAGITFKTGEEGGDWGFMLGYGQADANPIGPNPLDPILFRDTQTAQAGVSYVIGRGITIGAAAQYVEAKKPDEAGGVDDATTVLIESAIKF